LCLHKQIPLPDTIVLFSWRVATWEIDGLVIRRQ